MWRGEAISNPTSTSSKGGAPLEKVTIITYLPRADTPTVEKTGSTLTSGADRSSEDRSKASGSVLNLGVTLDADAFNGRAENETLPVNIGEPVDADSPLTDYTNETPVNLGELMDADNPSYSINDAPSEYQNIGPDMLVGEESDWRYVEPVNIGATMDADNYQRN